MSEKIQHPSDKLAVGDRIRLTHCMGGKAHEKALEELFPNQPETFTREEVSEWLERKLVEQGTFFKQVVNKEASQVLEELIAEIGGNNE